MFPDKGFTRRDFLREGASRLAVMGAFTVADSPGSAATLSRGQPSSVPDKLVVLTFDDAVKSHRTIVAPLLEELGLGATFFVTHRWMGDRENSMNWAEIAELHQMGFEIGNHTWTHDDFSSPRNAARLAGELALVEHGLNEVGVPQPVSFAYPGNNFGPEAVRVLGAQGYKFGRRGMQPEVEYGEIQVGPAFDPRRHHPLLIPTTADAYPGWTLEHFQQAVSRARNDQVVVLQFHGVPDRAHPWVSTPPDDFRMFMNFLKEHGYRVICMRELARYLDTEKLPADPYAGARYPETKYGCPDLPLEVLATQADLPYWLENMLRHHRYTLAEAAQVCGLPEPEVRERSAALGIAGSPSILPRDREHILVHPYPGGRHPRIGFLEGAVDPMRGTKVSVFLPWDTTSYVVVDVPEAIWSNSGLIFLAHTHIPTFWNERNIVIENVDWNRGADGSLSFRRGLPNGILFGSVVRSVGRHVEMEMYLRNLTDRELTGLRTQVCVMLKGAPDFIGQTNDNKIFRSPLAGVRSAKGDRWILTAWERCSRVWGNPRVPCFHSDPVFPDCRPGQTARVRGRLWFYEGPEIERELERVRAVWGADFLGEQTALTKQL